jgi:hypothetical protein
LEKLSAYLDGVLPAAKRAVLEDHLKTCEACAAKLDELARLEAAARKIPAPKLSEAYWENFADRVQNKITIREKQKTTPAWLENLKRFFQPTTGKLALAGSLATILLVAIFGQDYWKKETYQPPVFEEQEIKGTVGLNDTLQKSDLSEEKERQIDADKRTFSASGRRDEPATEKQTRENKQRGSAAPPASAVASKPAEKGVFRNVLKDEKTNETDLAEGRVQNELAGEAAPAPANKPIQGDTVMVTARRRAEIRKGITTSQVKVSAEEIEKLPIRNAGDRLRQKDGNAASDKFPVRGDTVVVTAGRKAEIRKEVVTSQDRVVVAEPKALPAPAMPPIDTAKAIADLKRIIAEKEKLLTVELFRETAESLYVFLGDYYADLYRFSLQQEDFDRANLRLNEFLQKDVSDATRRRLTAIQMELKKIRK